MTDQFRGVFLSISRLNSLRQRIEEQVSPSYEAFAILESQAQGLLNHKIDLPALWHVPGFYKNSVAHDRVRSTLERAANAAYGLALLYQITGHLHYCQAAIRLIRAWIQYPIEYSTADDSTLCFCYHFPAFLFAEPLISESNAWSAEDRERFSSFISTTAMSMSCSGKQNNWGAWGNLLETAVGANLGDAELIARAGRRWKELIEIQISSDGLLHREVTRNDGRGDRGIWYTHFSMLPLSICAEIFSNQGIDLFDYESPSGGSLRNAFVRCADWVLNPATFPFFRGKSVSEMEGVNYVGYFEILNRRWLNDTSRAILTANRPLSPRHSAPFLTLTHGEPII